MEERLTVNGKEFKVEKLLGKGKGGYSYLVRSGGERYVLKQIHHEPCAYYNFGDKLAAETNDYKRLCAAGVKVPRLFEVDRQNERLLKEYIEGKTVFELVKRGESVEEYVLTVRETCRRLYALNLNIDYFPTNFIVSANGLYYIDYECNDYSEEWNFENWGIKYWSKTPEFVRYVRENK